jgi:predicted nucleic acid-binding protein
VIIVDTSGLLAALFPDQRLHQQASRLLRQMDGPFVLSPFVLAELDYLIAKLAGTEVELALLDDVARGAYRLTEFGPGEVALARGVIEEYQGLDLGLADASIVVLAESLGVRDLLTLDERHFRSVRGPRGEPFRLLPADL